MMEYYKLVSSKSNHKINKQDKRLLIGWCLMTGWNIGEDWSVCESIRITRAALKTLIHVQVSTPRGLQQGGFTVRCCQTHPLQMPFERPNAWTSTQDLRSGKIAPDVGSLCYGPTYSPRWDSSEAFIKELQSFIATAIWPWTQVGPNVCSRERGKWDSKRATSGSSRTPLNWPVLASACWGGLNPLRAGLASSGSSAQDTEGCLAKGTASECSTLEPISSEFDVLCIHINPRVNKNSKKTLHKMKRCLNPRRIHKIKMFHNETFVFLLWVREKRPQSTGTPPWGYFSHLWS